MGLKEAGLRASVRSVSTVLPAYFDVVITNTNSPINEGDVLDVDYSVDNTGEAFGTQEIRLEIDSIEEDSDPNITLGGGGSTSGVLQWDTTGESAGEYTATVLSDDDTDSVTVEIPDAFFNVAVTNTNSPVVEGDTLTVDYSVENTGGVEDTQDLRLEIDNTEEDRDSNITLNSGVSTTGQLLWDTTGEDASTYTATVLSNDDSDSVTVEIESAIPDSDVYLHDDWGDNRLTNREDSGTTTHNGVEGVYRPEWTIDNSDPEASDTKLVIDNLDALRADININMSETVVWEISVDFSNFDGSSGGNNVNAQLFAESTDRTSTSYHTYHSGYGVLLRTQSEIELREVDATGNNSTILTANSTVSGVVDVRVERKPDGTWELFIDDSSHGTVVDNSHDSPVITGFLGRGDSSPSIGEVAFDEYKVR